MRRGFLLFALFVAGVFYGWNRGISRDGLARYIDAHPRTFKGDALLYTLGSFHELFNRPDRAVSMYERVVVLYPDSPHAEACLYGVASNFERLKNFAVQVLFKVNQPQTAILKAQPELVSTSIFHIAHEMHGIILLQRRNGIQPFPGHRQIPILEQLGAMHEGPLQYECRYTRRQFPLQQPEIVDGK